MFNAEGRYLQAPPGEPEVDHPARDRSSLKQVADLSKY
jgi:hypothetical protein